MASEQRNGEDERHRAAFGRDHTGVSDRGRRDINLIKNNDADLTEFSLGSGDAGKFTDMAWELLGGYIAHNDHLRYLNLSYRLTDSNVRRASRLLG